MKRVWIIFIVLGLILSSCQGGQKPDSELVGPVWYWRALQSMDDEHHLILENPGLFFIQFVDRNTVAVTIDCNMGQGEYTQTDAALTIAGFGMTEMDCGGDFNLEDRFRTELLHAAAYRVKNDVLYLELAMDGGSLIFTKSSDTELPILDDLRAQMPVDSPEPGVVNLIGQTWYWQGFQSMADEGSYRINDPENYSLFLNPDGSVQIQADCNSGFSSYTSAESALDLNNIGVTEMACGPDSLGDTFVMHLGYTATYVMQDGILYLNLAMDGGNLIFSSTTDPINLPFE